MKGSVKLSPATSLAALEVKARYAAALAIVDSGKGESKVRREVRRKGSKRRSLSGIEHEMRQVGRMLEAEVGGDCVVVSGKPARYATSCAVINVYKKADMERYESDLLKRQADPSCRVAPLYPEEFYVFYASPANADRLGSVAVYGPDACRRALRIGRRGEIFGRPIKSVAVKMGRRLFVDVELRA